MPEKNIKQSVWWLAPVIKAIERLKQDCLQFKARSTSQGYRKAVSTKINKYKPTYMGINTLWQSEKKKEYNKITVKGWLWGKN